MIRGVCRKLCNVAQRAVMIMEKSYATAQIAPLQQAALKERCILVDKLDRPIGEATKEYCHEIGPGGSIPLHRAFSIFLFNSRGELLLQKRSSNKVTFPDHYTNTCCSHPLAEIPSETEEENAIGVRRAAIRRLGYELGIPSADIKPSELYFLTRVHYEAPSDGRWGEHEIDYVFFVQKDVRINPNPDEVSEIRWVSRSEIENFMKTVGPLTPWFRLIFRDQLLHWWDNLSDLRELRDLDNIKMLSD
ncbi:hypothetical protein DMN91_001278 [Ooceraea biroi]|uniref:isopentenyl-diphosphate Delta-isomerase n=1 Tax=Ooceraea biroi TaxID=2015173 RepID=A0A026W5A6_OOCBI|nr:isopentenyl-diphosphate Delta-isomerase 1 [Ooceraea biroi]XP_019888731.1 isopentenyl-diphosphate Delta-isomerase 1 [Ooceraea biroi]EZA50214.1 Isopentenyl-diphosphate Delta-isomerase [Ooceraea biroi]RLU27474.1 hypothetical protein DMN91_001278 [Ooceraea biroi]